MTRDEAIAIRMKQLAGGEVLPSVLQLAVEVIRQTNQQITRSQLEGVRRRSGVSKARLRKESAAKRKPKGSPFRDTGPGVDIDAVHGGEQS